MKCTKPLSLVICGVCLWLSGCATVETRNPFRIDHQVLFYKVKTVVCMPVRLPEELQDADRIRAEFETALTAGLEQMELKVVPSREYSSLWDRMVKKAGGIYDANTGKPDVEKSKALRSRVLSEITKKFSADALVLPSVELKEVRWQGLKVNWDGVSEATSGKAGLEELFSLGNSHGVISALSLKVVVVEPVTLDVYYGAYGGIQLYRHVVQGKFESVPMDKLLIDPAKNAKAAEIALAPLQEAYGQISQAGTEAPK
jgi:hypothetical protein